jgi:hypothetical protein
MLHSITASAPQRCSLGDCGSCAHLRPACVSTQRTRRHTGQQPSMSILRFLDLPHKITFLNPPHKLCCICKVVMTAISIVCTLFILLYLSWTFSLTKTSIYLLLYAGALPSLQLLTASCDTKKRDCVWRTDIVPAFSLSVTQSAMSQREGAV